MTRSGDFLESSVQAVDLDKDASILNLNPTFKTLCQSWGASSSAPRIIWGYKTNSLALKTLAYSKVTQLVERNCTHEFQQSHGCTNQGMPCKIEV